MTFELSWVMVTCFILYISLYSKNIPVAGGQKSSVELITWLYKFGPLVLDELFEYFIICWSKIFTQNNIERSGGKFTDYIRHT